MKKFIYDNLLIDYKNNKGLNSVKLRKKWFENNNFSQQFKEIIEATKFLRGNVTMSERIYCILNDINKKEKCLYCKDNIKYTTFGVGYLKHCGNKNCLKLYKDKYKDGNELSAGERSGIGISKSQNAIQSNGKTKAYNSSKKAIITKRNNIKDGKDSFQRASKKAAISKYNNVSNGLNTHQIASRKAAKTMEKINLKTGKSIKEERLEKMLVTKNIVGKDGLDSHERAFLNGAGRSSSIKYYNKNLYYQGTYEKDFLDKLSKWNLIDFIKRGPRFNYLYEGKNRQYRSDYLFNDIVFEIKSEWTYGKYDKEKRKKNHLKFKSTIEENRLIIILDKKYFIEVSEKNVNNNLYNEKLIKINELKNYI